MLRARAAQALPWAISLASVRLSLVADSINALVGALAAELVLGLADSRWSPGDHIVGMPGLGTGPFPNRNFEGLLVDNGTHDAAPSRCALPPDAASRPRASGVPGFTEEVLNLMMHPLEQVLSRYRWHAA